MKVVKEKKQVLNLGDVANPLKLNCVLETLGCA